MEGIITQNGIVEIGQLILNYIHNCKIKVNGEDIEKELYKKTISDNKINMYIMLDDSVVGSIESISIISTQGTTIIKKTENIQKNTDKGLLISIPIKIIEDFQGSELR